jgi:hypothetical protein
MENTENTVSDKEVVEENNAEKLPSLSQAEKDEKFRQAFLALAKLNQLKKTKHRGRTPGAFGGAHPGIKKKKKLARYLAKNTIA